tara:strand:+ start:16539 stop:16700 length:162 start_codon:yes stop_codon:yes gene_type:complete
MYRIIFGGRYDEKFAGRVYVKVLGATSLLASRVSIAALVMVTGAAPRVVQAAL